MSTVLNPLTAPAGGGIQNPPFPTSIEAARANILASSKEMVARLNIGLMGRYLSLFNDWVIGRHAHPDLYADSSAPKPPSAFELAPPDQDGFVWYQIGTTPVCPIPPIPNDIVVQPPFVPNRIHVGSALTPGASWFHIGADDTIPFGHEAVPATSEDGVSGMFLKYASGVASSNTTPTSGWYLKVGA